MKIRPKTTEAVRRLVRVSIKGLFLQVDGHRPDVQFWAFSRSRVVLVINSFI